MITYNYRLLWFVNVKVCYVSNIIVNKWVCEYVSEQ